MTETDAPAPGHADARDLEFDFLARSAYQPEGTFEEKDRLWTKVLGLKTIYVIARGQFPDLYPYIASNPGIAAGQPMVKVFTDTERLHDFAEANGLLDADGTVSALTLPVAGLIRAAHDYARSGIYGLHFNADAQSFGFFTPFEQLPYIQQHLDALRAKADPVEPTAPPGDAPAPPAPQAPLVVKIRKRTPNANTNTIKIQ